MAMYRMGYIDCIASGERSLLGPYLNGILILAHGDRVIS